MLYQNKVLNLILKTFIELLNTEEPRSKCAVWEWSVLLGWDNEVYKIKRDMIIQDTVSGEKRQPQK